MHWLVELAKWDIRRIENYSNIRRGKWSSGSPPLVDACGKNLCPLNAARLQTWSCCSLLNTIACVWNCNTFCRDKCFINHWLDCMLRNPKRESYMSCKALYFRQARRGYQKGILNSTQWELEARNHLNHILHGLRRSSSQIQTQIYKIKICIAIYQCHYAFVPLRERILWYIIHTERRNISKWQIELRVEVGYI